MDLKNEFDLTYLLFNTLGFFDRYDCMVLFKKIYDALKVGSRAFIDTKNRDYILKEIKDYEIFEKEGNFMIDRIQFDPITGTTTNYRTYIKEGKQTQTPFTMYFYHYSDLMQMISSFPFKVIKILGGWKDETLDQNARRIILIL